MENDQSSNAKKTNSGVQSSSGNGHKLNPAIVAKSKINHKRHKQKIGFYYSFLTFVLLFCLVQVGAGVILNISKTIAYHGKINTMRKVLEDAEQRNKDLKSDISLFSKNSTLEELARNNLKMTGDKEVLIIINNSTPQPVNSKKHKRQ